MVKLRIEGERQEVAEAVAALDEVFRLLSVSRPYVNRNGAYVRVYADAEPLPQAETHREGNP